MPEEEWSIVECPTCGGMTPTHTGRCERCGRRLPPPLVAEQVEKAVAAEFEGTEFTKSVDNTFTDSQVLRAIGRELRQVNKRLDAINLLLWWVLVIIPAAIGVLYLVLMVANSNN